MIKENLKKKLDSLLDVPGVYLMKNNKGQVIYVGKAFCLKKRVGSYFHNSRIDAKTSALEDKIEDFEVIPVASEAEALILENNLIKKYQPKYNVNLKDGKSYPFVKISSEDFPSINVVREAKDDTSVYYGPFTDAGLIREMIRFLRRYYPVRNCKKDISRRFSKVCTQYHIGKCAGPCEGKISKQEYNRLVLGIKAFFEGNYRSFKRQLRKWLSESINNLDFEKAIEIRKRLLMLDRLPNKFPIRGEKELLLYGETNVLEKLAAILHLDRIPYTIEGFDVSNITGSLATAAKVLFKGGLPDKTGYRKYRIFFSHKIDDYRMIEEVLERRFSSDNDRNMPDLILIDGGRGHLGVAARILKRMEVEIPVISLSKENEEIHTLFSRNPIRLPYDSPERHLLQRVRDEAHRFALSYHRKLRIKNVRTSFFDGIQGIGEVKKKKLMEIFPDISSIASSDIEHLKQAGIVGKTAVEVLKRAKEYGG